MKSNWKKWLSVAVCILVLIGLCVLFVRVYQYDILKTVRYLLITAGLMFLTWKDIKERIIPNKFLLLLLGLRLLILIAEFLKNPQYGTSLCLSVLLGAAIGGGAFGLCYLFSRGSMGAGDVKLMAVLGAYLGNASIMPAMLIIVLCSGLYCGVKLLFKKITLKEELPFAPFILIGTVLSLILGV